MSWSDFTKPDPICGAKHHADAAAGNEMVTNEALATLRTALAADTTSPEGITHLLLKAAAGAGKSHALKSLVVSAAGSPGSRRIGVIAFTNNQILPLAREIEKLLPGRVCLHLSKERAAAAAGAGLGGVYVSSTASGIPSYADVIVSTAHKLKAPGEANRMRDHLGATADGKLFDALLVDEAWQLPHHLFDSVSSTAPLVVGVGDVGQLPPLEIGNNPWRGDARHNPYRAWPVAFSGRATTVEWELPAVWRPAGEALGLWRAFYTDWDELHSVAAPGDRVIQFDGDSPSDPLWRQVGTCVPTLLEVTGLPESEAPDVDLPLIQHLEYWLDALFTAGFATKSRQYLDGGTDSGETVVDSPGTSDAGNPLVVVLASRNQSVDDAVEMVGRLRAKHELRERDLVASTVDSWQGQTNALTVAIHPLSGATELDEFNSAFGRLAVACTRSTHGLLLLAREGIDDLITASPARPGTPFGEPGVRHLPRQTHQRILRSFARGVVDVNQEEPC